MANNENLKHVLTPEERARGRERGHEKRRERKQLKEELQALLDADITDKKGVVMSGDAAMAAVVFHAALKGDWRAWELVRDTSGQKPIERIVVAEIEPDVIQDIEDIVNGEKSGD